MFSSRFIVLALAGTALGAAPAQAGGLLGGGSAANCLCQAVGGLLGGAQAGNPGGLNPSALIGTRSVGGKVTGSVNNSLDPTAKRSIDRRNGNYGATAGLASSVNSVAGAGVQVNGVSKSVGLAGTSSTDSETTVNVRGVGTNHVRGLAGPIAGTSRGLIGKAHGGRGGTSLAGTVTGTANAVLSKSHGGAHGPGSSKSLAATLNSATNGALAVTKGHGQGSRSLAGTVAATSNNALAVTKSRGGASGSRKSINATMNSATKGALAVTQGHRGQGNGKSLNATLNGATSHALAITKSRGGTNGQGSSKTLTAGLGTATNGALAMTKSHGRQDANKSLIGTLNSTSGAALALNKVARSGSGGNDSSSGNGSKSGNNGSQQAGANAPRQQGPAATSKSRPSSSGGTYPFEDRINRDKN